MSVLWPMITPGTPEKVNPATSSGHAADTVRQCSPICTQIPGRLIPRWGSLASSGAPVAEWSASTTQELLPMPAPRPSRRGSRARPSATPARAARASPGYPARAGGEAAPAEAFWSNRPCTTAPVETIGACCPNG
jgi:hypothetical protein